MTTLKVNGRPATRAEALVIFLFSPVWIPVVLVVALIICVIGAIVALSVALGGNR